MGEETLAVMKTFELDDGGSSKLLSQLEDTEVSLYTL